MSVAPQRLRVGQRVIASAAFRASHRPPYRGTVVSWSRTGRLVVRKDGRKYAAHFRPESWEPDPTPAGLDGFLTAVREFPAENQTAEALADWLTEHPEALPEAVRTLVALYRGERLRAVAAERELAQITLG